jgi:hypothetical protein
MYSLWSKLRQSFQFADRCQLTVVNSTAERRLSCSLRSMAAAGSERCDSGKSRTSARTGGRLRRAKEAESG